MPQPFFIEAFVDTGLRKVAHLKMLKRPGFTAIRARHIADETREGKKHMVQKRSR